MSTSSELVEAVRPKLEDARWIFKAIMAMEETLLRDYKRLFCQSWLLGLRLSEIKAEVGHGRWLFWLGSNWPEIGVKKAQLCMQFFAENDQLTEAEVLEMLASKDSDSPNTTNLSFFSVDSIRLMLGGYIPAKVRNQLEGDVPVKPGVHHLTFVNHFSKWDRQLKIGHIPQPELEVMRRDCEPVAKRMIELLGREYFEGLLRE